MGLISDRDLGRDSFEAREGLSLLSASERSREISTVEVLRLRTVFSAKHGISPQWSLIEPVCVKGKNWHLGNVTRNTGKQVCNSTPEDHELAFLGLVDVKTL